MSIIGCEINFYRGFSNEIRKAMNVSILFDKKNLYDISFLYIRY